MATEPEWYDDVVMPALLRAARDAYRDAVRGALDAGEFDDVPANGAFVLGAVTNHGLPVGDAVRGLGVTRQAGSQLVDTLVARGYLSREADPDDRRRMLVRATERGQAAAAAVQAGVRAVDALLLERIGADAVHGLRRGLGALALVAAQGRGEENPERRLSRPRLT